MCSQWLQGLFITKESKGLIITLTTASMFLLVTTILVFSEILRMQISMFYPFELDKIALAQFTTILQSYS